MIPIKDFDQFSVYLRKLPSKKRVAVVCPNDEHSLYAIKRCLKESIAVFILITTDDRDGKLKELQEEYKKDITIEFVDTPDEAAKRAVYIVRVGEADILMKGLINTDNLLHAVLDKEHGILPKGNVLTHVAVAQISSYKKLIFFSDAAVIPYPTLDQFKYMVKYNISTCKSFGVEQPKVALLHCTEKISEKFPLTLAYQSLKEEASKGDFGNVIIDGPMDVKTACDQESGAIKGIVSPVVGNADILIFPDIEAGNTFYKTITLFTNAKIAGILCGTTIPVVVTSRGDESMTKYYSLCMACLAAIK